MRWLTLLVLLLPSSALAAYSDTGTSEWFKSLSIGTLVPNCCDQADCHPTKADFIAGEWVAESRVWPGEWVVIPKDRIVPNERSIFGKDAVICEGTETRRGGNPVRLQSLPGGRFVYLYCFVIPDNGT